MRDALAYPFDLPVLFRKRRALKSELERGGPFIELKIAILGGSTTAELKAQLEVFLLAAGIKPTFFESEYAKFYEDAVVDARALTEFAPDVALVHTTHHNVQAWPRVRASAAEVDALLTAEVQRFELLWRRLLALGCLVIQNNFDPPPFEELGHVGASCCYGASRFLSRLNEAFAAAAEREPRLRINDIARLAAQVGLAQWASPLCWLSYKMAVTPEATIALAHQTAKILRAAFGKTKKCLVLDLDDTLWGGVIGDDGVAKLRLGKETPEGEAFTAFQRYVKALKARGVLLAVCSKNDEAIAREGFAHPDSVLTLDDFSAFHCSWEPKPEGLRAIAEQLGIGLDSLVFVDDNPFERALVQATLPDVSVAKVQDVTTFAAVLDREGYFEPFAITDDDAPRAAAYAANALRRDAATRFDDYDAYLASLDMEAEIAPFKDVYFERITQLTNKTNQFNLTTRRYSLAEITHAARSAEHVTLYGRLKDGFGDNGLVSVIIGRKQQDALHVELWLMSCRVLKRTMELAMFDALCDAAKAAGVRTIVGTHAPTAKNGMVRDHYKDLGFEPAGENAWRLALSNASPRCVHIRRVTS